MKRLFAMVLALIMVFSLVGCNTASTDDQSNKDNTTTTNPTDNTDKNTDNKDTDNKTTTPTGEKLKIGVSTNALANTHNRHMFEGVIAVAKERGHEGCGGKRQRRPPPSRPTTLKTWFRQVATSSSFRTAITSR